MNSFADELNRRLVSLREQNLFRELRRVDSPQGVRIQFGGRSFLNFSSNDYLGLASHPALKAAAIDAVSKYGAGSGASRLVCGSLAPFHDLEEALAAFKKTGAALVFSSGYAAAVGAITALLGKDDIVILDKLVHASIVDAARLSGARLRIFGHNDLDDLEAKLKWAGRAKTENGRPKGEILVVTESIFSMDGDAAPLREIVALKEKYGAWLMVDEAHATGIFGQNGSGLADELGVSHQIEVKMGTLGKAVGAGGGFICGSRALVDLLTNRARSFIFSTAPAPAAAAAALAGIRLIQTRDGENLRTRLRHRIAGLKSALHAPRSAMEGAIIPLILGGEGRAVAAAAKLREQDVFVPAIRYPAVARGAARLRITLTAAHAESDVAELVRALKTLD